MKITNAIATILLLFGGLNWGLVGVADFNVIMWVFIAMPLVQHIIYIAIGLAAIWKIIFYKNGIATR
ncbi:MAG: DUF378 domain-containing protein [Chlamydiota bacterium]